MIRLIRRAGDVLGALGILMCLVAGASRLAGLWYLAGIGVAMFFQAGVGVMVAACLCKLRALERSSRGSE